MPPFRSFTTVNKEYVPVKDVIAELDEWLKTGDSADTITLSGSGEPTLNSEFGRVIDFVRNVTTIPVMEHAINAVALEKFVCFLAFIGTRSGKGKTWLKEFQRFTKGGAEGRTRRECIKAYLREARGDAGAAPA